MPAFLAYLVLVNVVAFAAFMTDKRQARRGGRRLSERALLGLALLGGSLGASAAMQLCRHKTRKLSFRLPFAAVMAVQAAGLCLLALRPEEALAAARLIG